MVQVTSQTDGHLTLESEGSDVTLRGNEGLEIDGMEVELIAEDDLELTTVSGFDFCRQKIGVGHTICNKIIVPSGGSRIS